VLFCEIIEETIKKKMSDTLFIRIRFMIQIHNIIRI